MLCVSIKLLNNSTLKIACDTLKKSAQRKKNEDPPTDVKTPTDNF